MATKHTPGPWKVQENADVYTRIVRNERGAYVCSGPQGSDGEDRANARLIAAAPELFKFVEDQARTTNCICRIQAIVKNTHLESDLECTHCRAEKLIRLATRGEGT